MQSNNVFLFLHAQSQSRVHCSLSQTPLQWIRFYFVSHKLATGWKNKLKCKILPKAFLCSHKGLQYTPVELLQD